MPAFPCIHHHTIACNIAFLVGHDSAASGSSVPLAAQLDPALYCSCSNCKKMSTADESCCCQSKEYTIKMPTCQYLDYISKHLTFMRKYFILGQCITDHKDFKKIMDKTVLELNLKLIWRLFIETCHKMLIMSFQFPLSNILKITHF